jgi:hypothetical protein
MRGIFSMCWPGNLLASTALFSIGFLLSLPLLGRGRSEFWSVAVAMATSVDEVATWLAVRGSASGGEAGVALQNLKLHPI